MLSKCAVERAGYEDAHAHAHGYEDEYVYEDARSANVG
jgi:hypothetical protein